MDEADLLSLMDEEEAAQYQTPDEPEETPAPETPETEEESSETEDMNMGTETKKSVNLLPVAPVSYTHLDVYKRQGLWTGNRNMPGNSLAKSVMNRKRKSLKRKRIRSGKQKQR